MNAGIVNMSQIIYHTGTMLPDWNMDMEQVPDPPSCTTPREPIYKCCQIILGLL